MLFWKRKPSENNSESDLAPIPDCPPEDIEELEARSPHEAVLRLAAEIDNMRRRQKSQLDQARRQERETVLRSFLEVLDNFERALDAAEQTDDPMREGLEAIHAQFLGMLAQHGVQAMDCVGEPFNPHLHEAVGMLSPPDEQEGIVAEVVQKGYTIGDGELLRAAKVVVR